MAYSLNPNDLIYVRDLQLKATVGLDQWHRKLDQPVNISFWLRSSITKASMTDDLGQSVNYGTLVQQVIKIVESEEHASTFDLAKRIGDLIFKISVGIPWVKVKVEKPRGLLRAASFGSEVVKDGSETNSMDFVKKLRLATIIGVNSFERLEKQFVDVDLIFNRKDITKQSFSLRNVVDIISDHVEQSHYFTLEALVASIPHVIRNVPGVGKVTVNAEKPSALSLAVAPGVQITRHTLGPPGDGLVDAYIALGSNLGDRLQNVETAIKLLQSTQVDVVDTSMLYETIPMYMTDQPNFVNGVCKLKTRQSPGELLERLKKIEQDVGRVSVVHKGPRTIDLDLLLYGTEQVVTDKLVVPHPLMMERDFVLKPLSDLSPNLVHPTQLTRIDEALSSLTNKTLISPWIPFLPRRNCTAIMAIVNLTPDSFSDGGMHSPASIVTVVQELIKDGAGIIDIGGQSSRPNAVDCGVEEELRRVIPCIKAIREAGIKIPISVDTYRAQVAKSAVHAGATMINDISAGSLDSEMLFTMAELNVPVCLMHMRGNPNTMNSFTEYDGDLVQVIVNELLKRVQLAIKAGVRRWNIIVDPGLGFAKTREQNIEILKRLAEFKTRLHGLPCLVGPSRKLFIGKITGVTKPSERTWGTASAVTACVAGGADIVRVHDVKEMYQVVQVADSIWRS